MMECYITVKIEEVDLYTSIGKITLTEFSEKVI